MRIGSLFSGAGGLDMAVEQVFGGQTVWHCEFDTAASKVLAHRWPDVPNLGDITAVDWTQVEPVDVICGGFPCQDVSSAGRRAGIATNTRSGLWAIYANAIAALRPRHVVIENVRGLLSATAHRAMESADTVVGDRPDRPVLRAAGAVLGDLADLGYDASWVTVAASDVGAPHRRERVFILATDTRGDRLLRRQEFNSLAVKPELDRQHRRHPGRCPVEASSGARRDEITDWADAVDLLPTPCASDGKGVDSPVEWARHSPGLAATSFHFGTPLLPTPGLSDLKTPQEVDKRLLGGHQINLADAAVTTTQWGKYAAAIARWESVVGAAPAPTEPNRNGKPRLNPAFSEWMMGWPAGWVTDPAIGISRNDQLRIIGNGVVPQQAIAALDWLLRLEVAA